LFCRINDAICLLHNVWRVKGFPPTPDGGSPCSRMEWTNIKPVLLRTTATAQFVIKSYDYTLITNLTH